MERYIGHAPEVEQRLQRILRNARDIKQVIQSVGQKMTPSHAHPIPAPVEDRPLLRDRRVKAGGQMPMQSFAAAHGLLDRYGCIVETAHDAGEAVCMVRATSDAPYDVIISDIKLPDVSGYQLMLRLQDVIKLKDENKQNDEFKAVPMILMTGFGYDPGHSIVNARKAGLPAWAILYKPFRLDQLWYQPPSRRTIRSYAGTSRKLDRSAAIPMTAIPMAAVWMNESAGTMAAAMLLLFTAFGHAAIWVAATNRSHATGWSHHFANRVSLLFFSIILFAPPLLAVWVWWVGPQHLLPWSDWNNALPSGRSGASNDWSIQGL